jgi:hypothetical protein
MACGILGVRHVILLIPFHLQAIYLLWMQLPIVFRRVHVIVIVMDQLALQIIYFNKSKLPCHRITL